jgi:DNA-directed RNA polymerase subunit L
MEIKVLESDKKRMVFELKGSDHTFCNALKKELNNDESVNVATYSIEHPLIGIPKFIVETDGKKAPQKAIADAAKRLESLNGKFLTAFKNLKV